MEPDGARWRTEELLGEAGWLTRLARGLVADPALAEDVAQETWIAALRAPPERRVPLRPWLARVARNFARQRLRADARRGRRERERAVHDTGFALDAHELSARLEGQRLLVEALATLREPYRSTVLLVYFEHKHRAEVARLAGVSESTVRWRLQHALEELRERLDVGAGGDRRAWLLVLAPLARSPERLVPLPVGPLPGVLAMSAFWKVVSVGVTAIVLLLGFMWSGVLETPHVPRAADTGLQPAPYAFEALRATPKALAPELETPADAGERTGAVASSSAAATEAWRIAARFVDPSGAVIPGVALGLRNWAIGAWDARAVSGADGRALLVIGDPFDKNGDMRLLAACDGFATREFVLRDRTAHSVDLGDVQLELGGALSGSVRDAHGAPVAGAFVGILQPRALEGDWERMRRMPFVHFDVARAKTDGSGRFELPGVAVGKHHVGATRADHLITRSAPIEVRARQRTLGVELVLERVSDSDVIDGVVLSADGRPLPFAPLYWCIGPRGSSGGWSADEHGQFRFVVQAGDRLDLDALNATEKSTLARVEQIAGGTRGLVLRLGSERPLLLSVRDARGTPLTSFRAWTAPGDSEAGTSALHSGETVTLSLPAQEFTLVVEADGFRRWRSAVLAPESLDEPLVAVLDSMPVLAGRVFSDAGPLPGAELSVWSVARYVLTIGGFRSRVDYQPLASGTSAADGTFALTIRRRATIVVRCTHADYAPSESEPIDYDPERGLDGLALRMTRGGAIEGRVLVAPGASSAGKIVGFSRGDGAPFTLRADDTGFYRAERLMPGRWMVKSVENELVPGRTVVQIGGHSSGDFPSVCTVVDGQTTHFDLGLGAEATFAIEGMLSVDGAPAREWRAALVSEPPSDAQGADVPLDDQGRFTLAAARAGPVLFALLSSGAPFGDLQCLVWTEVGAGRAPWSADLRRATLALAVPSARADSIAWKLVITVAPGVHALCTVPAAGGVHTLNVPAGRAKLVRFDDPMSLGMDPAKWPAQIELELTPGGHAELDVP
jgi:RNA polymerase sigma factor (sigma-70 family)